MEALAAFFALCISKWDAVLNCVNCVDLCSTDSETETISRELGNHVFRSKADRLIWVLDSFSVSYLRKLSLNVVQ